jgi:hypothetical protein
MNPTVPSPPYGTETNGTNWDEWDEFTTEQRNGLHERDERLSSLAGATCKNLAPRGIKMAAPVSFILW